MKEGWKTYTLGELCDILDSKRRPITKKNRIAGDIPYYGATGVLDYVRDFIFDEKLVLLGEDGAKWGAGEPSAYIITGKSWVNNHAHALRPHRDIITDEYLTFYLNFSDLTESITGVTVPKLNQEKMRAIEVPVPPLSEQEKIVSFLDAEFAKIDALKANTEQQLQAAKDLFQSALKQYLTPKEGWEKGRIGDVATIVHGKGQKEVEDIHGKYPIYGSGGNIMGYAKEYICKAGTTILGRKGSINNPMYIDEDFWNVDTAFGICGKENINRKFLFYVIKAENWDKRNTGTTLPSLTQKVVLAVPVSYPSSLKEQQDIVAILDTLSDKVKALQENYNKTLVLCNDLKQALLKSIFE